MAGVNGLAAIALFLSIATFIDGFDTGPIVALLTSVAGVVGGFLLMFQAPPAARRFRRFVLGSLVGSIAVFELAHFLPSRLGDVVPALVVGAGLSACWIAVALESSQADGRDPRWLRLLFVIGAVVVVLVPFASVGILIGVAGPAVGMVLMVQAPKSARRWVMFGLRGLIGSLAIVELEMSLRNIIGDVAGLLLLGLGLFACWVASAWACSRAHRTDPRWLRVLTIATGIAVVLLPLVFLAMGMDSEK